MTYDILDYYKDKSGDEGSATVSIAISSHMQELADVCKKLIEALKKEDIVYQGVIGFSLIVTPDSVKVVDFICRFCDVESQLIFSQIKTPLLDLFEAVIDKDLSRLGGIDVTENCGVCVVATSGGYPLEYTKNYKISIGEVDHDVRLYHAGTKLVDGELRTSGGRVITVACWGENIGACSEKVYKNLQKIYN